MTTVSTEYVRSLLKKAKAEREKHEDEISEAYTFTYPNRDIWRSYEGRTDRTKLYDSTATDSVQNLVSTILSLLITEKNLCLMAIQSLGGKTDQEIPNMKMR